MTSALCKHLFCLLILLPLVSKDYDNHYIVSLFNSCCCMFLQLLLFLATGITTFGTNFILGHFHLFEDCPLVTPGSNFLHQHVFILRPPKI